MTHRRELLNEAFEREVGTALRACTGDPSVPPRLPTQGPWGGSGAPDLGTGEAGQSGDLPVSHTGHLISFPQHPFQCCPIFLSPSQQHFRTSHDCHHSSKFYFQIKKTRLCTLSSYVHQSWCWFGKAVVRAGCTLTSVPSHLPHLQFSEFVKVPSLCATTKESSLGLYL